MVAELAAAMLVATVAEAAVVVEPAVVVAMQTMQPLQPPRLQLPKRLLPKRLQRKFLLPRSLIRQLSFPAHASLRRVQSDKSGFD
jgi:hypothetical protein